jgi:four helix bundle protein
VFAVSAAMPLAHEKLIAWQRADDLFIDIHRLAVTFPPDERFELASQIRRAAYSVPANIVEGIARRSGRDRLRFLNIAEASLAEVGYCLHASRRLGYIADGDYARYERAVRAVAAPLHGLRRAMSRQASSEP